MKKRIFFTAFIPLTICVLLLTWLFTGSHYSVSVTVLLSVLVLLISSASVWVLAGKTVEPLINMDIESGKIPPYDELLPFLRYAALNNKKLMERIKELESKVNIINVTTENMREGLILIDNHCCVLSANSGASDIFAHNSVNEGITMVGSNIMHIYRDAEFLSCVKTALKGTSSETSLKRNGKIYNIYISPVNNNNEISGAVILFLDTTEKYKAEKQRKEFSANVSHELKTPLTTISALSEMISSGIVKQEDIKSFTDKISSQTKRLINIIDDIIKISEFDEGNIPNEYRRFNLYELAESVTAVLRDKADSKNVSVKIIGGHIYINANMRMIDELLYNLVDNGIKYNIDGGKVIISLSKENGKCKISVSDSGIGIPAKHHERVFERFYRVDKSRSKKTGGTGLGLSIVKHAAEYHKGHVAIESAEGKGTVITCWIMDMK